MKDEHDSKRLAQSQKAYQASQSQLFSDERDSIDGWDFTLFLFISFEIHIIHILLCKNNL